MHIQVHAYPSVIIMTENFEMLESMREKTST